MPRTLSIMWLGRWSRAGLELARRRSATSWDGAVKVSDFGVAKAREATYASKSAHPKGKPAYLSPEYASCLEIDGRSDLFAVGVMLWEMLVGEPLLDRTTDAATLRSLLFDELPPPSARRPEIPADVDQVTMCLLERRREDRYSDARTANAALKECAAFGKHGCELLSTLLLERFPDRVPLHGPETSRELGHVIDAARLAPAPVMARPPSYDAVAKRLDRRGALQPATRLAMFGAVVVVAAVVAIIATSVFQRDAGSRAGLAAEPPSAAPSRRPGSGSASEAPRSSPPTAHQGAPGAPRLGAAGEGRPALAVTPPRPTDPAIARQGDRKVRPRPASRSRIITIDLSGSHGK